MPSAKAKNLKSSPALASGKASKSAVSAKAAKRSPRKRADNLPGELDKVAEVLEKMTERIVDGMYEIGARLPAEGALAREFGVSRTVMREAMRGLRARGLVEMSQGKLARVKPAAPAATVDSLNLLLRRNRASLLHLAEARYPLEGEIAALAARKANSEHLRQLEQSVHDLAVAADLDARIEADIRFHHILAQATGNPVLILLLETLAAFMHQSRRKTLAFSGVDIALSGHRAILAAVMARNPEAAHAAMNDHLTAATRDLANAP
jgi:GntR family transcriptional repressor for pyruvate dehydrogenase complex